ncbi:MAG: hypothetical protein K8953_02350, partial [Proteobacteria bacterium]|nr:hypothetical protein [Pseudomonadota bacterium]
TPPAKCTMIYVNGVDGTALNTCITDPFHTDCGDSIVDNTFASARAERIDLCAATNDPFNTACNIDNFTSMNDEARDTYCLTIAPNGDVDCAGTGTGGDVTIRTTEICGVPVQLETNNPFAPLCGTGNGVERVAFCLLPGQSTNPNCETDEAVLCAANPFGTTLGQAADVNCITPSSGDYSSNRKDLVDACREGTTLPAGTTCTTAINNCNANPFNPTAFSGVACDATAFADSITSYCTSPETTWNASCNTMANDSTQNAVTVARSGVCAANGAIMTGTVADDVAAGESLFDAKCLALTGTTDLVTITAAQTDYCAADANPWQGDCDNVAMANGGVNTVVTARNNV